MYLNVKVHKSMEQDDYNQGCIGSVIYHGVIMDFKCDLHELPSAIEAHTGFITNDFDISEIELDDNKINIGQLENEHGYKANLKEIDQWERGEIKLYCADYYFHISYVIEESLKNHEILALIKRG